MFKKAFHVKSSNVLKSSQTRKLKAHLLELFSSMRDLLDSIQRVVGQKLVLSNELPATIYSSNEDQPFAVEVNDIIFPTLYACLQMNNCLPILLTHQPVIERLAQGADFMLPGLVTSSDKLPKLRVGNIVALAVTTNPHIPLAIGVMLISTEEIAAMTERRGKAVTILHTVGDTLCSCRPSRPVTDTIVSDGRDCGSVPITDTVHPIIAPVESNTGIVSVADMDSMYKSALRHAIKVKLSDKRVEFPILLSTFNSAYILSSRAPGTMLDIKKSSWSKLTKFAKQMDKEGYLKIKEQMGETYVVSVNSQHEDVRYYTPMETAADVALNQQQSSTHDKDNIHANTKIKIVRLYRPSTVMLPIFVSQRGAYYREGGVFTENEVAASLDEYIVKEGLRLSTRSHIKLNPVLYEVISNSTDAISIDKLARNKILQRLLDKMQQSTYRITVSGKEPVIHKGQIKPVEILIQTRRGNKVVTLIRNLDKLGLPLSDVSRQLSTLCASSTSIGLNMEGGKDTIEILVQGNKGDQVKKVLCSYGVPEDLINYTDKRKSAKKQ